ncbi:MAG: hypothetical protein AAF581_17765 [Planctomycetota bacterium]
MVKTLRGHESERGAVCFSPNGRLLAAGGYSGIRVWKVGRWQVAQEIKLLADEDEVTGDFEDLDFDLGAIEALQFSPDSRRLYGGGDSRKIHVWDTKSWRKQEPVIGHEPMQNDPQPMAPPEGLPPGVEIGDFATCEVQFIQFPKKGRVFASGGRTHALRLWRWHKKKGWLTFKKFAEKAAPALPTERMDARFSADGTLLASAIGTGHIEIVDVKKGKVLHDIAANKSTFVTSVEFAPDGKSLYATGQGLKTWDVSTGELRASMSLPSTGRVVRRSRDGKHLAIACEDRVVRIYAVTSED